MKLASLFLVSLFMMSSLKVQAGICEFYSSAITYKEYQYKFALGDLKNWQELARESRETNKTSAFLMKISNGLLSGTLTLAFLMAPPVAGMTFQLGVGGYMYSEAVTLDKTEQEIFNEVSERYALVSPQFAELHTKLDQQIQNIDFDVNPIKNALQLGRPMAEVIQKRFELSAERAFLFDAELKYLTILRRMCSENR